MYEYEYPHPAITTDSVVFTLNGELLQVLLIQRGREPDLGSWALPGGFLEIDEDLDSCAHRELAEETGLSGIDLHQFYAFGAPERDSRERVVTIAYYALVSREHLHPVAGDDAAAVAWVDVTKLPELAVDHAEIIAKAHARLILDLDATGLLQQFIVSEQGEQDMQAQWDAIYDIILNARL
jgi:8-oxo-dGTP diphosphatase